MKPQRKGTTEPMVPYSNLLKKCSISPQKLKQLTPILSFLYVFVSSNEYRAVSNLFMFTTFVEGPILTSMFSIGLNQLVVNWCLDSWDPRMKGIVTSGHPDSNSKPPINH